MFNQIKSQEEFEKTCFETFEYQYKHNKIFHQYVDLIGGNTKPKTINELTFLPIDFFKTKEITSGNFEAENIFTSSSTTGLGISKHYVKNNSDYEKSFRAGFQAFYGDISKYLVLALLPSYLERNGSSLVYMAQDFINESEYPESGFFLDEHKELLSKLQRANANNTPTLLLGVTYALLDFSEAYPIHLKNTIVMETGGMKGRKKEITRPEVHDILKANFGLTVIHSEYGMTELLSQAYSKGNGIFECPPWMGILIRDTSDPLQIVEDGKSGGVNIIDLANQDSCSFIATQDLGKTVGENQFEILGRFDNSEIRGCNLLAL